MTPDKPSEAYRRERSEPTERFTPIPVAFLIFVAILTAIGFGYMVRYAGDEGFNGDMRTPSALAPAPAAASGAVAAGDQIYASLCSSCHQASGLGLPGVFPPLAGSEWVKAAPELSIKILLLGLGGSVTVKGQTYNGQMPSFKQLSDVEIAAVLTHVRSSWGNGANAVTADAVKSVREGLKDRTDAWKGEAELGRPPQ
jgi:mono/diheme cytochrome c family protein